MINHSATIAEDISMYTNLLCLPDIVDDDVLYKIYVFHQSKIGGEVENVGLKKNRPEPRIGEHATR